MQLDSKEIEEYLNSYPEEEQQQYQLKNTSTQESEPTITEQDDIETGTSTLQIDGNSAGRYALCQNLFEGRDTIAERHHQDPNEPQPATITQGVSSRSRLGEIACAIVGFTSINAFFTASNMLGALISNEDVYEVGLAAAVGSVTLTTIGALFHLSVHCAGSRLEKNETASLHVIGGIITIFGPNIISSLIGQLILHGGSTAALSKRLVADSLFGCFVSGVALCFLLGFGLLLMEGCGNPPSSDNATLSNNSVGISSVPKPHDTSELRSKTPNMTHANPHRFRFSEDSYHTSKAIDSMTMST